MKKITETQAPMGAWEMASSVLVGLNKTVQAANDEREAALETGQGNPFFPGISLATQILEIVCVAKRDLAIEMTRVARSSGLAMPELSEENP